MVRPILRGVGLVAASTVWTSDAVTINKHGLKEPDAVPTAPVQAKQPLAHACECLPWAEVYKQKNVKCGQGHEMYVLRSHGLSLEAAIKQGGMDFCTNFYQKLSHNKCTNIGMQYSSEWYGGTWCYVSSECNELGQGNRIEGTGASYKTCDDRDVTLRDMSLDDLVQMGINETIEMTILLKLSYPTFPEKSWDQVKAFWDDSIEDDEKGLRPQTMHTLQHVAEGKKPMLFDGSFDGGLPLTVTVGKAAWQVQIDAEFLAGRRIKGVDMLTWLVCIHKCPEVSVHDTAAIAQAQKGLPSGWHAALDTRSSKYYYYNDDKSVSTTWKRPQGTCACLNWREAYQTRNISCGDGLELARFLRLGMNVIHAKLHVAYSYCTMFYKRLNHNFCTRVTPELSGDWYGSNWCYVDPSCTDLNGGQQIKGSRVSYKFCDHGADDFLGDRSPEELIELQKANDITMEVLAKMAYPVWPRQRWPEVQNFYRNASLPLADRGLPAGVKGSLLQALVDTKKPMYFEAPDGGLPFVVTQGLKAYYVNFSPQWYMADRTHKAFWAGNFANATQMTCVHNCLPPGWHEEIDMATNRHYFWHDSDRSKTTWQRPEGTTTPVGMMGHGGTPMYAGDIKLA